MDGTAREVIRDERITYAKSMIDQSDSFSVIIEEPNRKAYTKRLESGEPVLV